MEWLQFYQAGSQSDLAMDSEQLRELIKQEEGAKLDFKIKLYEIYGSEKEQHWDEFIKDILSLTNGNIGTAKEIGYLVIGVGDKFKPNGTRDLLNVDDVKLNRKQFLDKVNSACHPPLPDLRCETVLLDGKNLFVVSIPPSPYLHELSRYLKTPKKGYSPYTVLIRRKDGEKVYEASEEEKQKLRQEKETIPVSCVDDSKATTSIESLVQEVRSCCCDKIQHLYSKIQLLNRQQIDVDQLYVDVYVLEKLSSESYATIPDLLKGSDLRDGFERLGLGKREKRSPGFEVAAQYRRLMILGKPGSGKSTFLRHLAVACCKGEFQAERIPILIELRDIKDATRFDLLNRIHKEFGLANQAQTEQILNQGKVLILLDGLDEVSDQSRRDVQDHIYEFSQQYYKNRFILTCRTQTTEYALPMFDYVEVADFNPEQVKIFTQHWFSAFAETPKQGEKLSVQLLEKLSLPENEPTAELAVTPILLSLTCWVFTCLKDLPAKRSDLYEQGINLLLEKWDEKRGVRRELGSAAYRKLSMREKQRLLSYIASRKFTQEQYVLLEQSEIQGYISEYLSISTQDSQAMLEAIETQHGLLIERAYSIYSFSHLTFQEYFTAKWFVENADWQGLVSQITENHWREVFLLAVGACNNANHLLQLMKQQVDILIAADKNLQQFLIWLTEKSQSVETKCNPVAIRAFYFSLELYFNYGDVDYAYDLPARTLDSDLPEWLNFELEQGLIAPLYDNLEPDLALDVILTDPHYLFDFGLERTLSLKLRRALQKLYIPHYYQYDEDEEGTEEWWNRIGVWKPVATLAVPINQLRTVLIEHRNFGHNWCFTEEQEKLLKQYYDTNKLLVACLNGGCVVSDEVKKEIEDTLLLPIAEVEKRQQQTQVTDVANE